MWFHLWLLFSFNILRHIHAVNMLGPADLIFKTFEHCEEPQHIIDFWVLQRRHNRTTNVLDMTLDTPYDIGDKVVLELKGWLKKEGGYKPGSFYMKDKACDVLNKLMGETFLNILHAAGVEDCPLPAGEHEARGYYFDNNKFTVPQLYGEYKMEILLFKDDEIQSCFNAFYDLVAKKKS